MKIDKNRRAIRGILAAFAAATVLASPMLAAADESVRIDMPPARESAASYRLELEPHFAFGAENVYGASGFGAGLRVGVPLFAGALGSVPDNLAISFGGDVLHYDNCYYARDCGANYLLVPVALQWNVFVARPVSVFLEGGAFLYKGWFDGCAPGDGPGCSAPSNFGILPTVALGGRLHLGRDVALTLRLGYPTTTLGVSFL
ncbi:MAG TPA: hypothetical protein VIF09_04590 [Polyangiaceae bacterium]|jgi:hypothetical protein